MEVTSHSSQINLTEGVMLRDVSLKIIVMGDSNVGKSSLVNRFSKGASDMDFGKIHGTIGVDFAKKEIKFDDMSVDLQIWDTAGQERYRAITASYFRNADGAVVVYDVSNRGSFENLEYWLKMVELGSDSPEVIIVGNKIDKERREVTRSEGLEFAKGKNMLFMETSVLIDHGIVHIFEKLARRIIRSGKPLKKSKKKEYCFTSDRGINSFYYC